MAVHIHQGSAHHMARHAQCAARLAILQICRSKKTTAVNELGQETIQKNTGEDFEMVSINSVYFNKNHPILTANLKNIGRQKQHVNTIQNRYQKPWQHNAMAYS